MTASAWLNDLRNQIEQTRILSTVYRSASALGASARAKVAGAGAVLRPVSSGTQVTLLLCRGLIYLMPHHLFSPSVMKIRWGFAWGFRLP